MTYFEQTGVKLQEASDSVREAEQKFRYSCKLCCQKGLTIECERCAINNAHNLTVSVLMDIEADRRRRYEEEFRKSRQILIVI